MKKLLISTAVLASSVAFAQPQLTVYTYDSFVGEWGPAAAIEEGFEAVCQCDLTFVAMDDGVSIFNRLQLEGASSDADVVLGLDSSLMQEVSNAKLMQAHTVKSEYSALPIEWTHSDFVAYDWGHFAFVYNSETFTEVPSSLKELVENQEIKVVYQDPRTSTPGLGLMLWMKDVFNDQADVMWQTLAQHTVTVTPGWTEAYYNVFQAGEADMVLSYTTSPAAHVMFEDDHKFKAAVFSEGHYLQVEVAGVLATADNTELANQFLTYLLADAAQSTLVSANIMNPVNTIALPEAWSVVQTPAKTLSKESADVAANRQTWTNEWLNATTK